MKTATMERRFFANDDEWEYFLSEMGIMTYEEASGTDVESVDFLVDVEVKTLNND